MALRPNSSSASGRSRDRLLSVAAGGAAAQVVIQHARAYLEKQVCTTRWAGGRWSDLGVRAILMDCGSRLRAVSLGSD